MWWQIIGLVLGSALFWMQYADVKDRYQPEPRGRLLLAFFLGIGAALLSLCIFGVLDMLGMPVLGRSTVLQTATFCFAVIGPVEEGTKILVALWVFRWPEFDEPIDGFVYATAISLGFASVENFLHLPGLPLLEQLARVATLPLTHSLFASIWGLGIARARLMMEPGFKRTMWQVGSVFLAMELHGLYDFIVFALDATWLTSILILFIWVFVIWRAHQLAQEAQSNPRPLFGRKTSE